jgi:hypothetical protein
MKLTSWYGRVLYRVADLLTPADPARGGRAGIGAVEVSSAGGRPDD